MSDRSIPTKTALGQRELSHREKRLGQRHRTVLLLVDGRRTLAEVLRQAQAAGASRQVFDELVRGGMVTLPEAEEPESDFASQPLSDLELPTDVAMDSSLLPPAQSLLPASDWAALDDVVEETGLPKALEEARALMIRAVRRESPVSGSLTIVKLKMARSREDLINLVDEVELRLAKPRRRIIAAQTMRHVRHLLTLVDQRVTAPGA